MAKRRSLPKTIGVAVVAGGLVSLYIAASMDRKPESVSPDSSSSAAPRIVETPTNPAVSKLLGGLKKGDDVAGWKVKGIYGPTKRLVHVELEQDGAIFMVGIGVKGSGYAPAPIELELYELGFGNARGEPSDPVQLDEAVTAITERVRKNEKTAPRPEGM